MKTKWILANAVMVMAFAAATQGQIIQNGDFTQGADGLADWTKNDGGATGAVKVFTTPQSIFGQTVPLDGSDPAFVALAWVSGSLSPNISQITGPSSPPITISFDYNLQAEVTGNNPSETSTLDLFVGGIDVASLPLSGLGGTAVGDATSTGWTAFSYTDYSYSGDLSIEFEVENSDTPHYSFSAELANISAVEVPDSCSTTLLLSGVFSAICFIKRKMA